MYLTKKHEKFLEDLLTSSKLDKNPYSFTPSVVFLSCTFLLMYIHFHQYPVSSWSAGIYKDMVFHWAYFYIVRIWLVLVKLGKYITSSMDQFIEENSPKEEIVLNQTLTHVCVFLVMLTMSMFPLVILSCQQIYRSHIPNFLTWIVEDPRTNSEMGTSGQYLERPPHLLQEPYKRHAASYRSKRSTSFNNQILMDKGTSTSRPCKSMTTISGGKSLEILLKAN